MASDAPPTLPGPPTALLRNASLFIDFDGTLVELAERPDTISVDPALHDLIGLLGAALPGRIAIVSGRSIAQLDHFLGAAAGIVALAGSHGVERRYHDGREETPARPAQLSDAAAALVAFAERHPGTIVEEKSFGVALHYRLVPEIEPIAARFACSVSEAHGLDVQPGKMMMDLKVAGGNKGQAVDAFMKSSAMTGTTPWFIGDDLTDEAGFVAARDHGGGGILVGPPRPSAARFHLATVSAVRDWLGDAIRLHA